jgi:hypothetical protein
MKKINKENYQEIKKRIKEAGDSENYITSWEEGVPKSKRKSEVKKGRISKARGARFELKVRRDLEDKGRFVDKWNNNVDLEEKKLIIAKRKYNPFSKVMTIGTGFPDFISFKEGPIGLYSVIGVEVKINGILSKIEKEKCMWYLQNKVFSEIWIAKAKKIGRKIEIDYTDFREKYMNKV